LKIEGEEICLGGELGRKILKTFENFVQNKGEIDRISVEL